MPPHDQLDLARVLLARAVDDETLVRKVCSDTDVADSIIGFHAQLRTWTESEIETADQPPKLVQRQPDEDQPE